MKTAIQFIITGCRDIKEKGEAMKKQRGSLTLEAALFLTMFMMGYMAFMDLVQIGRTQMILQYTLDETVKEISQSTYILTKAGIVEKSVNTGKKAEAFKGKTSEMVESVKQLAGALENGSDNLLQQSIITGENVGSYFGNSDELLDGIVAVAQNSAGNMAKTFLIDKVSKGFLKKQLRSLTDEDPDQYLKKLGLENGMSDIKFEGSKWFDSSREIDVVMTYRMTYHLGILGTQERVFKVRAKTAVW